MDGPRHPHGVNLHDSSTSLASYITPGVSPRSDDADDISNEAGSFKQDSYGCRPEKSRKQNIREVG